ncbi:hypothetical protein OsI_30780 [Oryza sativa Indica Group]|uniref:DUF7771 domain-containing protein n=1 Tax=Oryza sativa subsp. indica TaxID=39946 RepID=A2YZJ7_ORYSI|nr:hypothetical protein OsI_30780 [Oryza sativa Indica Group]
MAHATRQATTSRSRPSEGGDRSSTLARRRLAAATTTVPAIGVLILLLALAPSPATATVPARRSAVSYYASVENRLPAAAGMELVCRALGPGFDVYPELSVVPRAAFPAAARASPSWGYEGNYLANLKLFDTEWPEAAACQDPAASGGELCRLVFEDDAVSVVAPGGERRVVGDLPVKRCRRHWLLFSTGCTYPDHPNPYAGRLLRNALEFFAV